MIGRVGAWRRLLAILATIPLLLVLALAWQIRPPLPVLPHSLGVPFPPGSGIAALKLAAWALFVLLDLTLCYQTLAFGSRRQPTATELRLRRALRSARPEPAREPVDWRAFAAPPPTPVLHVLARTTAPTGPPEPSLPLAIGPGVDASLRNRAEWPPESADGRIGLRLLGPLELIGCKRKQPRRKATGELLSFLAVQQRPASRDELIEALWPEDEVRRSAERFNQAATEARRLLGDAFHRSRDNFYRLDRRRISIDLDLLDQLCQRIETAGEGEQGPLLERALSLFAGRPFAGIDALWADAEARRLEAHRGELLERLAVLLLETGEAGGALAAADQAALLDRSNERPAQLAMQAEAALGHRDAVVERYERLCRQLDDQFGLEPSRDTKQLYRSLLSQDAASEQPSEVTSPAVRQ